MTATCRESCCNMTPRLTVNELFDRGYRRNREAPRAIQGRPCHDGEGNTAHFSLDIADGRIAGVSFRVSCCATLIAYSELIVEMTKDARVELAAELTSLQLVAALPGVHVMKRDRAVLAIAALRAALEVAGLLSNQGGQAA